ncbi:murein biosynthesis integral membrane protein MurJ [Rhodobacteraceae bacterium 2376]|uniref:Probable lipid II flippase MurJ n=1 Tax=Rhabdonatronobacter sediminivivens TaxID=2743469 RepID=A0A7Z0KWI8_9RHOB|nr:murein biosynthesis integral membrane protein MurJ [Rhabdonatronobacter sediminivivens]NYS24142.1 murein biosynthesis integral membrane protein MurJ [Rhabdonatronobacter sediminivivens]
MTPIRLISGFLTVGLWTLFSRIFGFVRDVAIAAYLGAGPVAEAFLIAFALPNMFRRFFAEGAFNMAFVPIFAKKLEQSEDALGFARNAAAALGMFLLGFSVLAHLAMPWLVMAMAYGFRGDERFDMAVLYGRIAFPYILFISLAALLSGVLNSIGRFAVAAAVPTLLNVVFIAALVLADWRDWPVGDALAWAVPVAGVAQLGALWWSAARAGFVIAPQWPRITPEMKRLLRIMGPAILAGGVVQINLLVGRQVASFFEGAVAWLSYADRLYQLPLGVVGIAIGVVLLPDLSRRLGNGDTAGGRWSFSRALEFSLALTLPSAVALMVIAGPIVSVLFERGQFGAADTAATALALAVYGAGLPAFVLQKVLQPLYFARHDTRRPFNYAVVAMVVNAVLAVGLAPVMGYIAAALATSVAGWVMVWQLWRGARPLGEAAQPDARFTRRLWRQVAASLAMGMALWALMLVLDPWLIQSGVRYLALAALILGGSVVYFVAGAVLGAFNLSDFRSALRRKSRG